MHSRVSGWLRRSRTLSPPSTLRPGSTIAPPPPLEETRDLPASALPLVESASRSDRVYAQGKFLYQGQRKFYVKGVTYGSFPPNRAGYEFPEPDQVDRDLALMHQAGINTILTYTVPPLSLLDQAGAHDIRVLINIPWMGYECFLEERQKRREIRRTIRDAVAGCQRHPAVLMYAVSKELPPQIVRWQGKDKIEGFLHELYQVAKEEDPDTLVTYTNYPTTEYLELPFVDVATFNVYLHRREDFCAYLARLQHLAGELPLVMTELGMCSFRHGPTGQANFIDWQLREVFDHGLAGAIVFGWTDPFYQDNTLVEEWGFGLVDADRQPKPSFQVARRHFSIGTPFGSLKEWPKISVVVALHNAGDTIDACLDSLLRVSYPHSLYEVIVVNDGSTDNSQEIIDRYPFRSIVTENQGVSSARNEGFRAATGDIVAYIDSDAEAEPDWLAYLARTFLEGDYAAVGGPNLIPDEDNWIAKCVYRSPGGPTQVMLDDQRAEHIPGCNMAFWKWALEEIDGFDPRFRAAGDDVDVCWRLIEKGHSIGFSPSAVVWHHRRPSIKGYWKQQVGYGISESILENKHPSKFNPWGHTFWGGRIYAPYPFFRVRPKPMIYHGLWGSAPFQPMYDQGGQSVWAFLPRAMEWHFLLLALGVLGVFIPWAWAGLGAGLVYSGVYCVSCGRKAKLKDLLSEEEMGRWTTRFKYRAMIAWLHFLEPIARDWGRLKGGLTPWRSVHPEVRSKDRVAPWYKRLNPWGRTVKWTIPGGMGLDKHAFLRRMHDELIERGCAVGWNTSVDDWDLKFRRGTFGKAHLRLAIEHHGGPKRAARLSCEIGPPGTVKKFVYAALALVIAMQALGYSIAALISLVGLALVALAILGESNRLEAVGIAVAGHAAAELDRAFEDAKAAASEPQVAGV